MSNHIKILTLYLLLGLLNGCYSTEVISGADLDTGSTYREGLKYPIAYIPSDREVIPGQKVTLKVALHPAISAEDVKGFEWSQVSGPSVYLSNNSDKTTSFIVPPTYEDIILQILIRGRYADYKDTIILKVVDKIEHRAPYADSGGDLMIPVDYYHTVSASYSQGTDKRNIKYIWKVLPESDTGLEVIDSEKMETPVVLHYGSTTPRILILEAIEDSLRSTRDIKLIHTNETSISVVMPPRLMPENPENYVPPNASIELVIKDLKRYNPSEVFWYQLSGEYVELLKTDRGAIIKTGDYVDDLVLAAFVKIEDLFTPPIIFKVYAGRSESIPPPVADAGVDQKVSPFSEVRLNGSKSSAFSSRNIKYIWKQVYGPSVKLKDDDTAFPTFIAPKLYGRLIFSLTVNDGFVNSRPDTVIIDVSN